MWVCLLGCSLACLLTPACLPAQRFYSWKPAFGIKLLEVSIGRGFRALTGFTTTNHSSNNNASNSKGDLGRLLLMIAFGLRAFASFYAQVAVANWFFGPNASEVEQAYRVVEVRSIHSIPTLCLVLDACYDGGSTFRLFFCFLNEGASQPQIVGNRPFFCVILVVYLWPWDFSSR